MTTRRKVLGATGYGAGIAAAAVVGGVLDNMGAPAATKPLRATESPAQPAPVSQVVPFRGAHQAGILTAQQGFLLIAAFDVHDVSRLAPMLSGWTTAIEAMTAGQPVAVHAPGSDADSPSDPGEAVGLGASRLTVTVGYGVALLARAGVRAPDAAGLALPPFGGDELVASRSGGDIVVQACADDATVAFHAVHELRRLAVGTASVRWLQSGFGRTSSTSAQQGTPRNLMGFKDGTRNVKSDETQIVDSSVWSDMPSVPWLDSVMVVRQIRMNLDKWDKDGLGDQQAAVGRMKASGAPLGLAHEFDTPVFSKLPPTSHVRLAAPENNGGIHLLRRGYSYNNNVEQVHGALDAGLFFIAFMADLSQFVIVQSKLSARDDLTREYLTHVSSGVFAVPRGLGSGEDLAGQLYSV